ncbi:hypothetical protein KJ636_02190 [Patescibacteria group bacterium]|nr:hypothetical protein [Patescibacteria group bacterium]MBU4480844.1 hypothetical protein [Patescibacteria group bacterium]
MRISSNKPCPEFLRKYFWDINFKKLDAEKYPYYVIERILEYGDEKAVKWMMDNFRKSQIKHTLMKRRGISKKSAVYWALILNIQKEKILCLNKRYQSRFEKTWPY